MHSPDITQQNIDKLLELFPNCKTEKQDANGELGTGIDFDLLKQELSKNIVEGPQERYQLDWPGKKKALFTAYAPIAKTLRPCREESVDFDTTENLFIEGDNLDALKLLQETYLGKVKMIYIDPPYNTGSDFIYADDFSESSEQYMLNSGQLDADGNRLIANTSANGRFHSDWLSMIYSRLKLAKTLLAEDGVVFIQIDENEISNLRKVLDEIFGEKNFVNDITVKMSHTSGVKMSHANKKLPKIKETILIYSKNSKLLSINKIYSPASWDESLSRYSQFVINITEPYGVWQVKNVREAARSLGVDTTNKPEFDRFKISNADAIFRTARNNSLTRSGIRNVFSRITTSSGLEKYVFNDEEVLFASEKLIEMDGVLQPVNILGDIWSDIGINNLHKEGGVDFKNGKKPLKLLKRLLSIVELNKGDIVLDFFAGSASTAHAVMEKNSKENKNYKSIMVQLPEICDEKSEAYKAGYSTIAEISKERIRRAGKKIKEDNPEAKDLDTGFRVLKIDSSNMNEVHYTPDAISKGDLFNQVEHIKTDRSSEDLLFQVMLDWGVDLSLPIRKETIEGKEVYFVNDDDLVACFDKGIDELLIKALAAKQPLRVVFRDDGFVSDSVKINVEQIFKQLAPATDIKAI